MPFVLLFVTAVFLLSTAAVAAAAAVVGVAGFLSSALTNPCELMAIRKIIVQNDFIIFGENPFVAVVVIVVIFL